MYKSKFIISILILFYTLCLSNFSYSGGSYRGVGKIESGEAGYRMGCAFAGGDNSCGELVPERGRDHTQYENSPSDPQVHSQSQTPMIDKAIEPSVITHDDFAHDNNGNDDWGDDDSDDDDWEDDDWYDDD